MVKEKGLQTPPDGVPISKVVKWGDTVTVKHANGTVRDGFVRRIYDANVRTPDLLYYESEERQYLARPTSGDTVWVHKRCHG